MQKQKKKEKTTVESHEVYLHQKSSPSLPVFLLEPNPNSKKKKKRVVVEKGLNRLTWGKKYC